MAEGGLSTFSFYGCILVLSLRTFVAVLFAYEFLQHVCWVFASIMMRLVFVFSVSILLFKGLHLFEPDFFLFQNTHTFLYLSRDKPKG